MYAIVLSLLICPEPCWVSGLTAEATSCSLDTSEVAWLIAFEYVESVSCAARGVEDDRVRAVGLVGEGLVEDVGGRLAVGPRKREVVIGVVAHLVGDADQRDREDDPHGDHDPAPANAEAPQAVQQRSHRASSRPRNQLVWAPRCRSILPRAERTVKGSARGCAVCDKYRSVSVGAQVSRHEGSNAWDQASRQGGPPESDSSATWGAGDRRGQPDVGVRRTRRPRRPEA